MQVFLRILWIISTLIVGAAVIWFLIGTTAGFNRGIDLITTVYYVIAWAPAVIYVIVSAVLLFSNKIPKTEGMRGAVIFASIAALGFLVPILYSHVNTEGWLTERIKSDPTKTTSDGLYEYHMEVVNPFQRNVSTRIYLLDQRTGEESRLNVDLSNYSLNYSSSRPDWIVLEPTGQPSIYMLITIKPFSADPQPKFEVDIANQQVKRIE